MEFITHDEKTWEYLSNHGSYIRDTNFDFPLILEIVDKGLFELMDDDDDDDDDKE